MGKITLSIVATRRFKPILLSHIGNDRLRHGNCTFADGEARMIRTVLKLVLVVIVILGLGAFLLGRWGSGSKIVPGSAVHAAGPIEIDTSKAREAGAKVGEETAKAANEAERALANGAITAKIKSKMVLDD